MKKYLLLVGAIVLSLFGSLLGFFGAAAMTSSVAGLCAAALLLGFVAAFVLARIGRKTGPALRISLAITVLIGGLGAAVLFHRPSFTVVQTTQRGGAFEKLALSTGSKLAVVRVVGPKAGKSVV